MLYLKFRRIDLGLTQRQVADKARLRRNIYTLVENERVNARPDELARVADALGCDVNRLFTHVSEASLGDGAEHRDEVREEQE